MSSYQLILSFLVIQQVFTNSLATPQLSSEFTDDLIIPIASFKDFKHYQYHKTSYTNCLSFQIRTKEDAHIILFNDPNRLQPSIEIIIGGWNNTRSVIRKDKINIEQTNVPLSDDIYLGFWISWYNNSEIRVGKEGINEPFMSWNDPEPIDINYFSMSLCRDSVGTWIIEEPNCPDMLDRIYEPVIADAYDHNGGLRIYGNFNSFIVIPIIIFKIFC